MTDVINSYDNSIRMTFGNEIRMISEREDKSVYVVLFDSDIDAMRYWDFTCLKLHDNKNFGCVKIRKHPLEIEFDSIKLFFINKVKFDSFRHRKQILKVLSMNDYIRVYKGILL